MKSKVEYILHLTAEVKSKEKSKTKAGLVNIMLVLRDIVYVFMVSVILEYQRH